MLQICPGLGRSITDIDFISDLIRSEIYLFILIFLNFLLIFASASLLHLAIPNTLCVGTVNYKLNGRI